MLWFCPYSKSERHSLFSIQESISNLLYNQLTSIFYFRLFKQTLQFLQQINVKNVHPVHDAGIRTHNLWSTSLLPLPQDQGSCTVTMSTEAVMLIKTF